MVFLTSVDILDTGFLTVSSRTGQLSTANRANSGSALRLKGVELEISSASNLDKETYAANYSDIECPVVSVNPDEIKLTIWLNKTATASNIGVWATGDMQYIAALLDLPKTRGFKAIYYPVDAASGATVRKHNEQILYYLGITDTTESQGDINLTLATSDTATASSKDLTDVKYIPVRFESCDISQDTSGGVQVTLTGVRTA